MTDQEFDVSEAAKVIGRCDEFFTISKDYSHLFKGLKLLKADAPARAFEVAEKILQSYPSSTDALEFILSEWQRKCGTKATVAQLILVLKQLEYENTAELLRNRFLNVSAPCKTAVNTWSPVTSKIAVTRNDTNECNPLLETSKSLEHENGGGKMSKIRTRITSTLKTFIIFPDGEANFMGIAIGKFERLWGGLHIIVSLLFLFTFLFGGGSNGYFGADVANMFSQIRLDIFRSTKEILHNTVSVVPPGLMNNESYQISVGSYSEFQKKMNHIPDYIPVNVSIQLNSSDDWPNDVPLKNSGQIRKLTLNGTFYIDTITSILRQTKHIEELHIIDSMRGLCHRMQSIGVDTDPGLDYPPTVLSNLRTLYFENFSSCSKIYRFFSTSIIMKSLNSFHLINSIVDQNSTTFVQQFLKKHWSSLKKLSFPSTRWSATIFVDDMPVFPHVSEILMDFLTGTGTEFRFIGTRFHHIFPNLAKFTSKQGFPSWIHFLRLLECKNLRDLTTKLLVPPNSDRINMNFLRKAHSTLQFVDISFFFPNKTWTDRCEVEGLDNERPRFTRLTVKGNCDVCEV